MSFFAVLKTLPWRQGTKRGGEEGRRGSLVGAFLCQAAHSGAGAPAPSSEPELREAPDAAAVVPDFRQTMVLASEAERAESPVTGG